MSVNFDFGGFDLNQDFSRIFGGIDLGGVAAAVPTPGAYANPDGSTMTLEQMQPPAKTDEEKKKTTTPEDPDAWAKAQAREAERRRVINAIEAMRGMMTQYGLGALMGRIEQYVRDGYNDPDAIMALIRTTPEYKQRFPAMEILAKKNRAISEGEYIAFEQSAAQLERAYGLPAGMVSDKDTITNLLGNEVSGRELEERVTMAAAGAFQTTSEVKDMFKTYYGIDAGGLTAYFLDPEKALPLLNKQYASAQIGAEAEMQAFDLGVATAERITELGIGREEARAGFQRAGRLRPLSEGRGDIATQQQLIGAQVLGEQESQRAIERAQASRTGRFQQGGQALTTQRGVAGAGTAATR
jgi:hypothetical protein